MQRYEVMKEQAPIFALHAKTLVVDQSIVFIGTYNLDPRSENLNTEVGVVIYDPDQATFVRNSILTDVAIENSWNAKDEPDQFASFFKRIRVWFWQWMPIKPLL
jgi:putative cardiolipin synthase